MDLIRYSIGWVRGEIVEMTLIAVAGAVLVAAGVAFSRLGATPLARALLVPLVALGVFYGAIGVAGYVTNQRRIPAFEAAYREDPAAFARAEKARVEGFQYMYTITNVLAPASFAVAVALFWWTLDPRARAAGLSLVVFGLLGLFIDGFSKERADLYYASVLAALPEQRAPAAGGLGAGRAADRDGQADPHH